MTRHGKNCTAGAVYTYHEKRKDTAASGYGTQRLRLGRDAVKDFDCCCLSLQPCRDPVVTPEGFLYEREAILQYLLQRRTELARQQKAYERQRAQQRREREQRSQEGAEAALRGFLQAESPLGPPKKDEAPPGPSGTLPSFWIPSLTPEAGAERLRKPDRCVRCPMSGSRLRSSDLVPVRFRPLQPGLSRPQLLARSERYVCALSGDVLSNATPCAVLRPSVPTCPQVLPLYPGAVVTMECVERLIRKDMRDPLTGEPLTEADIIVLQRGGTGFAGSGTCLEAKKSRPVMQA